MVLWKRILKGCDRYKVRKCRRWMKWGFATWAWLFHLTFACIVVEIAHFPYCDKNQSLQPQKFMDVC